MQIADPRRRALGTAALVSTLILLSVLSLVTMAGWHILGLNTTR